MKYKIALIIILLFHLAACQLNESSKSMNQHCGSELATIQDDVLRLLTLNTAHGRGTSFSQMLTSNKRILKNLDQIAELLAQKQAHIVALQETDAASSWSGNLDQVTHLRERAAYLCSLHSIHVDTWLASYGNALLSVGSLKDPETVNFAPSPPTTNKGFVRSTIHWQINDQIIPIVVVSVHLDFSRKSVRDKQVARMLESLVQVDSPIIVMGDLNSGWRDQRSHVKQLADELGLNVFEPENPALGTYKSTEGKRLDWILSSKQLQFSHYEVLPNIVSDHLAVYAEITYKP